MIDRRRAYSPEWFHELDGSLVRRAVGIAVTWAYVAGLAALIMVALAALVSLAVVAIVYLVDFAERELELEAIRSPTVFMAWIVAPAAALVSVWSAAYGSTREHSIPRAAVGVAAGLVVALLMWGLESTALVLLALSFGWSFAIPVDHPGRWGTRVVLPVVATLLYPRWPAMSVVDLVLWLGTGPAVAGALVLLGDMGWDGIRWMRGRGEAEMVAKAPSTEDA